MKNRKFTSFITIEESKALYGIAILLMIFHHCFCDPSKLNYDYIPLLGNYVLESRIAWVAKLCVGIYAFITGYAFSRKSLDLTENISTKRFKSTLLFSLRQLKKFYGKFWIVCLIFIPIGILFFGYSSNPIDLIKALLYGKGGYNGEWWYVSQYIKFLIAFPILDIVINWISQKFSPQKCLLVLGGDLALL